MGRSYDGRPLKMNLGTGCVDSGAIQHEMIHGLGFHHEQTRPDRDGKWLKIILLLVKNPNFGQKIAVLVKNSNLGQKSKYCSKIEILDKNRNFGKKKFWRNIDVKFR